MIHWYVKLRRVMSILFIKKNQIAVQGSGGGSSGSGVIG